MLFHSSFQKRLIVSSHVNSVSSKFYRYQTCHCIGIAITRDGKVEKKALPSIHETSRYIRLARLVTDLAEQWLKEEEARVTGFTVVRSRPTGREVDI